jgi:hypothetical protein
VRLDTDRRWLDALVSPEGVPAGAHPTDASTVVVARLGGRKDLAVSRRFGDGSHAPAVRSRRLGLARSHSREEVIGHPWRGVGRARLRRPALGGDSPLGAEGQRERAARHGPGLARCAGEPGGRAGGGAPDRREHRGRRSTWRSERPGRQSSFWGREPRLDCALTASWPRAGLIAQDRRRTAGPALRSPLRIGVPQRRCDGSRCA